MNLADKLSLSRIPLAIIFTMLYSETDRRLYLCGMATIFTALATDLLDGFLARRYKLSSQMGYILDGLGDRAVYIAVILTIGRTNQMEILVIWLVVFREILVYAVRLLSPEWFDYTPATRVLSKSHAVAFRLWCLSYLVADGIRLFRGRDLSEFPLYSAIQGFMLIVTVSVAYALVLRTARANLTSPHSE